MPQRATTGAAARRRQRLILSDSYCRRRRDAVDRCKKRDRISKEFGEDRERGEDGEENDEEEDDEGESKQCVLIIAVGGGADNSLAARHCPAFKEQTWAWARSIIAFCLPL